MRALRRWAAVPECGLHDGHDQNERCRPIIETAGDSLNTPPTAPALRIQPTHPRPFGSDLRCEIESPSIDTDGDAVAYTVSWTRNGSPFDADASTHLKADTVLAKHLREGDDWACPVAPTDGTATGPVATSTVTVGIEPQLWGQTDLSMDDADFTLTGEASGESAGSMLASAGDIDGDGRMDLPWATRGGPSSRGVHGGQGTWSWAVTSPKRAFNFVRCCMEL